MELIKPVSSKEIQARPVIEEIVEATDYISQNSDDCPDCKGMRRVKVDAPDGIPRYRQCWICNRRERFEREYLKIPSRFADATFSSFEIRSEKHLNALKLIAETKAEGSYLIIGAYGSGKTHLLYAQYKALLARAGGGLSFIRSTKDLIKELVDDEMDKTESQILNALREPENTIHLFWDDADKFKVTEFKLEALFDVIDKIYKSESGLTVTSNCDLIELQEKLNPAIVRRIDDICMKIEL